MAGTIGLSCRTHAQDSPYPGRSTRGPPPVSAETGRDAWNVWRISGASSAARILAQDVSRLGPLRWVMETSMLKTLAGKHKSTVMKMARRYGLPNRTAGSA